MDPRLVEIPRRISLFGISALPPFHLRVFNAVSRFSNVHLFLMNPLSRILGRYHVDWRDQPPGTEIQNRVSAEDLHIEKGNSLLASMGMLGRDFFAMLYELDSWPGIKEEDFYIEPGTHSQLHCIQSDILNLQHGSPEKTLANDASNPDTFLSQSHAEVEIPRQYPQYSLIESQYPPSRHHCNDARFGYLCAIY